jgi:hypothetical protein
MNDDWKELLAKFGIGGGAVLSFFLYFARRIWKATEGEIVAGKKAGKNVLEEQQTLSMQYKKEWEKALATVEMKNAEIDLLRSQIFELQKTLASKE